MKNTKTDTELLKTIRKWEDLCDESLADAAYWKGQAQNVPDLLAALREIESKLTALLCERVLDSTLPEFYEVRDARNSARAAIAKAEGVK
jgi:hypothetical protein